MKKVKTNLLLVVMLLLLTAGASAQNVRGFYITKIGTWLGNATQETEILEYAQGNGFNYILFYDMGSINWSSSTQKNKLASFISRAKTQYNINQVGAVVEASSFVLNNILPYNSGRTNSNEKFDVINQEFEFWVNASISGSYCNKYLIPNGYSCDTAGAWKFAWKEFKKIDSLCAINGLMSEYYIGWPNRGQLQQLATRADRILVHAYRQSDGDIYPYSKSRLNDIASLGISKKVMIIFSAEPDFMGPWLNNNSQSKPFQTYSNAFTAETGAFKQFIDLQGYQWFTYQLMPKTIPATAMITANGPLAICAGESVVLTANAGTAYLWSPGGQTTRSITATNAGSYTVRVTNSGGQVSTSAPAVVTASLSSGTTPVITASGSTTFCPGGNVTLTSSNANSYLWSTGETTQSITVNSSGSFSVTTGSGACSATSSTVSTNANSAPAQPSISSSGPLEICNGTTVTLSSTPSNGYLWSTGETTQSIVVSAPGNYFVSAYSGPFCSSQSSTATITALASPAQPAITTAGSTILTTSNTSVRLTSSSASNYLWNTNQTGRSITVYRSGTYQVVVTGSNGCTAASPPIVVKSGGCTPPSIPVVSLSGPSVLSNGQSVTLTSSSGGGYLWSTGATSRSISVSTPGTYWVRVYNAGYCFSTSLPVVITAASSTARISSGNPESEDKINTLETGNPDINLTAFPVPARDVLTITFQRNGEENMVFQLMDITGKILVTREVAGIDGQNQLELNVSEYPRGIYLATISDQINRQTVKIILE